MKLYALSKQGVKYFKYIYNLTTILQFHITKQLIKLIN